ncbi:thiamine pyrophosphate-binding protein [Gordonia sp. SID5947]|uniref:thiamine pyrophosphate-binding protein n=1 Tax=Gordonia sp. SID5947 TaxID=2690315 RepID=UPI00136F7854|nr:thiamine pyrophosphate-binding protein [Gordonia sp. SID5947]MYR06517.1 thiamine pyrophosphate-binding protein [Gordonia sp. SID5947]
MARDRSTAEHLMEVLHDRGVRVAYGVHGANIEDMYAAAQAVGICPVVAKHEFAAGAMADGTTRVTGRPGVVMTTSGGGAMNVVPALAEAYDSRVPVLALIGSAPTGLVGRGAFQDMLNPPDTIDLVALMAAVSGSCAVVSSPETMAAALATAWHTLDRGLPAVLIVPKDVQAAPMAPGTPAHPDVPPEKYATSPDDLLDALAERLAATATVPGRVCLWVGEQASWERLGTQIGELAETVGATTVASPGGRDVGTPDDGFAGVTGVMGHPSAHVAIHRAEMVIAIGCRMSITDRAGLDDALHSTDLTSIGRHGARFDACAQIVTDDLEHTIRMLTKLVGTKMSRSPGIPAVVVERLQVPHAHSSRPDSQAVIETIGAHLPPTCAVFADAGNAGAAALHHLPFSPEQRFTVALGMGGMGHAIASGVGNAVRCAVVDDRTRSIVIAGDGAFFMHGMEMHTAIEHDAPLTLIVLNNDAHGMCVTRDRLYFPEFPTVNRFRPSAIAAGLDAMFPGLVVRHAANVIELGKSCAELFASDGPNCLVIDVDPEELPPFAPFL